MSTDRADDCDEAGSCGASVSFKTVGCRLNQAETARMRAVYEAAGYRIVPFGADCDVCVVHGCAVTASAQRDSIRAVRRAKRQAHPPRVVLAGCVVEIGGADLRNRSGADFLLGQARKFDIPLGLPRAACACHHPSTPIFQTVRAILKVSDGCDFYCSYCVVPRARGRPNARPLRDIIGEASRLAERGFNELVLTGANLGAWRHARRDLVDLLDALESVAGIARIRLSSLEPTTVERRVAEHMAHSTRLCRALHLPVQSGSNTILTRMRRRYTIDQYRDTVHYCLDKVALLGLGTDIIVGFPGETDAEFEATCALVTELPFSNLHVFPYSRRPDTDAATMPNSVAPAVKKERAAALLALGNRKRADFARRFLGREVELLVERVDGNGSCRGWTQEYLPARISRPGAQPNDLISFRPTAADSEGVLSDS